MDINEFMDWKALWWIGNDWDYSKRVWISERVWISYGKGLVKGDLKGDGNMKGV